MSEIAKLKLLESIQTQDSTSLIKEKFISACINLDPTILEPFIDDENYFDGTDKYRFLDFLSKQMEHARRRGETTLTMKDGICEMCVPGAKSIEFYGENNHKPYMAYMFMELNGILHDIVQCNGSSGWSN